MFFSIVIPLYNCEKYIEQCLSSILKQKFLDYEIVVVDDGSIDNSNVLVEKFAEKEQRIKLIRKENGGVASARNYGILNSSGKYLIFLDADDILVERSLWIAYNALSNNEVDMAICSSYVEMSDGHWNTNKMFSEEVLKKQKTSFDVRVLCQNISSMCIALYRREFLICNGLLVKEGISCGEDTDFYFRSLLLSKSVSLLDCTLFACRHNPNSVSNNLNNKRILDVMSVSVERMRELIECPSNALDNTKALNFFSTKFIHFSIQIFKVRGKGYQDCIGILDENKDLLRFAQGKEEKAFTWLVYHFGSRFAVRLFGIAVSMRKKFRK